MKKLFLISIALGLTICQLLFNCGARQQGGRITNTDGNYSINILPGWVHEVDGIVTRTSRFKTIDGEEISGTLLIDEASVMFDDLDRNFESQLPHLYTLEDFKKIGEGRTEIDGSASRWIRLNDSENKIQYTTLQYVIQRPGNKILMLNCSAQKKTFDLFEEEFNKMVFSLKLGR